ncbi:signal peptidase I [Chloroflexi bacterium]|nr:signal peptidase I [Chloroflexota bacterium]
MYIYERKIQRAIREIVETAILAVFVFSILYISVQSYQVEGASMTPNINQGDCVIANKAAYWKIPDNGFGIFKTDDGSTIKNRYLFGDPNKGDVIVFTYPKDPNRHFIKRVIGKEGDSIHIDDGKVYVNSQALKESYLEPSLIGSSNWGPNVVGIGEYFVLGDNRRVSNDSRSWGTISSRHIVGKYLARYPSSVCSIAPMTQENLR